MNSGAVDNRFIVMPNNPCVNFRGGEAWARVNGDLAWFQSRTAAFPIVQVHEFGHNRKFQTFHLTDFFKTFCSLSF